MLFRSKRVLSSVLAFALVVSGMVFSPISTSAAGNKVDVWDFGGVAMKDTNLYENHIDTAFNDALTMVGDGTNGTKGAFIEAGNFDFNGLTVNSVVNDRYFYNGADGLKSYGSNAKANYSYTDGYTANGMWYANGTGGDNRRYMSLPLNAGDLLSVYTAPSNSTDLPVHFTSGAGVDQVQTVVGGDQKRLDYIAATSDTYKVWFDAAGGKPIVNRIVRYPAVNVTGNIDLQGNDISGYTVSFKNETTGDIVDAVLDGTSYSAALTPGYTFTAILNGAVGYGFTNKTKTVEVSINDILTGKTADLAVETKSVYKVTGAITGFADDYNLDKLVITLVPDADSMADTVTADLDKATMTYSATLEPDIPYTVTLAGVNDYEVKENGVINDNLDCVNDITVGLKAMYNVTGKFIGYLTGNYFDYSSVKGMTVTNMEDGYTYTATVENNGYTIQLRDGNYEVSVDADGDTTSTHIAVNGKDTTKDVLINKNNILPELIDSNDIYVGCTDKTPNFATMTDALEALNNNVVRADGRVTVHIAPGVYREQISLTRPDVTFVKEGDGEVKLTWYYGIGYNYYSIDSTGYYNYENAFDKFSKNQPQKWGTAFYLKEGATGFKAEGITFENSFNQYITDEEIADGVKSTGGGLPERTYATDVKSKAATERATAICIESDNTEFKDCTFVGSQDTLYIGGKVTNHVYFKNCLVQGNTDYIFGSGNAVFDGCELRFGGYTDTATGGYITAGRSNNYAGYLGYLFRACSITNADGTKASSGYFGRPWDANADITFLNCTVPATDTITAAGWNEMSGVKPDQAKFKEFGTTLADGTAIDVSKRVAGTVLADASGIVATDYFGGWTPTYYTEDTLPLEFTQDPYLSTDGDVLLPATGNTFNIKYSLGANDANDASIITYSLVAEDGTETVVKSETAVSKQGILLTKDMIGYKLKITITPKTIFGNTGKAVSVITEKEITLGSGTVDTDRPSGKAVVFLAGDSTVKDYSAGAINNSGANRSEGSWGEFIKYFVDDSYEVMDYAEGGRSSRTFMNGTKADGSDKFLDKITEKMMAGDYLYIQFGHNDSSASYADRYVPVGTPDANGKFPYTAQTGTGDNESGTFCWYLQQYVDAAKAVGATPVLVTPVARMYFTSDGTIRPHHGSNDEYVTATKQVAEDNGIECIDLYAYTKNLYEECYKLDGSGDSSETAYRLFANSEKTHHSKLGGYTIAAYLADYIKYTSNNSLSGHITVQKPLYITDDKGNEEFSLNNNYVFTGTGRNANGIFDSTVAAPEYLDKYVNDMLDHILNADTPEPPEPPVVTELMGDADGDDQVTANDVAVVMQNVLNGAEMAKPELADVNKDGKINTIDAAMILQHVLDSSYKLD